MTSHPYETNPMSSSTHEPSRTRRVVAVVSTTVVALAAASLLHGGITVTTTASAASSPNAVQRLEVRTRDYAFEMPATLRAGLTQVTLVNEGKEPHHLWILKLEAGKKLADVFAAMTPQSIAFPSWAKNVGGPNAPVPGGKAVALMNFEPGHYAVLCVIPAPDGTPHLMKGMAKEFDVVGPMPNEDPIKVDIESQLVDYDFAFAKPLTPGRKTIRFTNAANQVHEAFIAKLPPGKRAADLLAWEKNPQGPPPVIPMGGITGIEPGTSMAIIVDLEPGTYAFYCFVPDAKDGKAHIAHGMMKEFVVAQR